MMGKPYTQYGAEPLVAGGLEELRGSSDLGVKLTSCTHFNKLCTLLYLEKMIRFDYCCFINIICHTLINICGQHFVKYREELIFLCISENCNERSTLSL